MIARGLTADPARRMADMDSAVRELAGALARPRHLVAAGAAAVAVSGIALAFVAHDRGPAPCSAAGDRGDAWTADRRDSVRAQFAAVLPDHEAELAHVTGALDGYATRWAEMRVEACEASAVHHTQSPALLDLRMQCLEQRRRELGVVAEALATTRDRERLARASSTVLELSPLAPCADGEALTARVPPPSDLVTRARVDELDGRLGTAVGLERTGDYRAARALAGQIASAADQIGYAPLAAEALYWRGRFDGRLSDHKAAEAAFGEVVRRASIAHDDRLVARAWIGLVDVVGVRFARRDEGLTLARAAEAAVLRAGNDPLQAADLHAFRGTILRDLARFDDALAELRDARELRTRALPAGDLGIARSIHDLAELERVAGKREQARADHETALAMTIAALGPDHPMVAVSLGNLGACDLAAGQLAEARRRYERALAILERALPPDGVDLASTRMALATVAMYEGKLDEATAGLERAGASYRKTLGDHHPLVANIENNLGQVERGRARFAQAQAHYEQALAIRLATGPRDHPSVATALSNIGDMLHLQHHDDAAGSRYREALAIFTKVLGPTAPMTANPLLGLGEIALDAGDRAQGIAMLERAAAVADPAAPMPTAEIDDRLARAVWDRGDRARARDLASKAVAAYRRAGGTEEANAVASWLAHLPR
jgi:tetratricopeptide (TPR) repeat protein